MIVLGPFTQGEIPAPVVVTFLSSNGAPLPFPAGWVGRFLYRDPGGVIVLRSGVTLGATDGSVTYAFVADDMDVPGLYEGNLWVGNGGTFRFASEAIHWSVKPAPAGVPII